MFPHCIHHEMSDMGCSVLPATVVRDLHRSSGKRRTHVATYLPTSMPWSWLFGPPGWRPGPRPVIGLSHLLAWHETVAETLSQATALDGSSKVVLRDRWAELNAHGPAVPQGRPAERLPAYADSILRDALRERLRHEHIGGLAIEAWDSFVTEDELLLPEGQEPFEVPATLSGLMFTPLPEA